MKRTSPGLLIVSALIGVAVGFGVDTALTANGQPTFTPAVTLPVLLVALGGMVLAFAWPIRRSSRSGGPRVNPFRAVRIAMLAKASSMVGAVVGGAGAGMLGFLLTRPVSPALGSVGALIATVVAGVALIVAALVAEHWCTIRKDDDDDTAHGVEPGPAANR